MQSNDGPPALGGTGPRNGDGPGQFDDFSRSKQDRVRNPRIYNEFLDIMRNFKAQVIDRPSVIKCVSNLLRSRGDLIVGFNRFLPDGHKIRLHDMSGSIANMMPVTSQRAVQRWNGRRKWRG